MWCSIANYILLIIWFLLIIAPHGWMFRVLRLGRRITVEDFDRINMAGMVFYKFATLMFFVIPFFVIYFVNRHLGETGVVVR